MPAYTIRLSDDLRKAVRVAAAEADKSMNQWIVDTLNEKVSKKEDAMIEAMNPWTGVIVEIDPSEITDDQVESYAQLMDDDLREELHDKAVDNNWTPGQFLKAWADRVGPKEAGSVILGS